MTAKQDIKDTGLLQNSAVPQASQAFRFYDNREKYLLFVTTCSEKEAIATRIGHELDRITPTPPALRLFDAGMGDASVLNEVLFNLHYRFPTVPFLIVAKEISLEDVRLSLVKMPSHFVEHPQTVLVITNMKYSEAPTLQPSATQKPVKRWEVALQGKTTHEFLRQIHEMHSILEEGWQTALSPKTGNPLYVQPSALIIYRADQKFPLTSVIPPAGPMRADYDLIICAQPYRSRSSAEAKVKYVLGPLAASLGPGGRLVVVQSTGYDPGMEIIRHIWPDEEPFRTPRHDLIEEMKKVLAGRGIPLTYSGNSDDAALFKYHLHALPTEIGSNFGTSFLLAAWNAAVYVAQIDDAKLEPVLRTGQYLEATRKVLKHHGGLWFLDESFVVTRRRES
ncbi:MAG: hypothetical protein R3264_10265 [Anaerolineae bacterium]|nr:hypothetical protein [Anaerolineae bacterium]